MSMLMKLLVVRRLAVPMLVQKMVATTMLMIKLM